MSTMICKNCGRTIETREYYAGGYLHEIEAICDCGYDYQYLEGVEYDNYCVECDRLNKDCKCNIKDDDNDITGI